MMRQPTESRPCELRLSHLKRWLGAEIEPGPLRAYLQTLGFNIVHEQPDLLYVETLVSGSLRAIDLVDAIARAYGYDAIRSQWPTTGFSLGRRDRLEDFKDRVRRVLVSQGYNEAYNEGLLDANEVHLWGQDAVVSWRNPSVPSIALRPSLLLGLLKNIRDNERQQVERIRLFELGKVFCCDGPNVREQLALGVALAGHDTIQLEGPSQFYDFQDLKGLVENLLLELGLRNFAFEPAAPLDARCFDPPASLAIKAREDTLGYLGSPRAEWQAHVGLRLKNIFVMELDLERIFSRLATLSTPNWYELKPKITPAYPAICRGLAISVSFSTPEGAVRWVLEGEKRVETLFLSELIPAKERKLLRYEMTLRDWNKTLTAEAADEMIARLKQRLVQELQAEVEEFSC
jgi:phenylalanyl-tRNA synthetase beta chain